jgi:hypothetical protein
VFAPSDLISRKNEQAAEFQPRSEVSEDARRVKIHPQSIGRVHSIPRQRELIAELWSFIRWTLIDARHLRIASYTLCALLDAKSLLLRMPSP